MNLTSCKNCGLVYDLDNVKLGGEFNDDHSEYENVCWYDNEPCHTWKCQCGHQNDTKIRINNY